MATDTAPADPLMTTELTAAPTAPISTAAAPAVPANLTPPAQAPAQAGATQPVVDRGDPDVPRETANQSHGIGTDGETNVWEARYSMRNFLGRLIFWGVIGFLWVSLAVYTWAYHHEDLAIVAVVAGLVVGFAWLALGRRILLARFGHYYRLTNRRVFVSTGLFSRRRDQMELLRVQDVYTRQSLLQRWMSIGTVVIVSSDQTFPILYLAGVNDPKFVMDLVWHHARAERDRRSVKVDQI